jgi:hypothetical protein
MRVDRRDESLFLFFGNFARGDPYIRARAIHTLAPEDPYVHCPGRSIRSLPGRPVFLTLTFKVRLPFFSKFYRSWKLPFFSKFYRSWKLPFFSKFYRSWESPKFSKNVSSWKECRFLAFTTNFFQEKKLPKFSKNVSSWGSHFFPNFTEAEKTQNFPKMLTAGKPIFSQTLQKLGK